MRIGLVQTIALAFSASLSLKQATAFDEPNADSLLRKRVLIYETLCDDGQDNVIGNPIFHAVQLANATLDNKLPDGTDFRHSTAYSNYFEDEDYAQVSTMMQHINDYTFKHSIPEACKSGQTAFADPDPYPYGFAHQQVPRSGIGFCPPFFDPSNREVQAYFWSKSNADWCKAGNTFADYYTVGFLTMKLFTQTEAYGSLAGLPPRFQTASPGFYPSSSTHGAGTLDHPPNQSAQDAARKLKQAWKYGRSPTPRLKRVHNAASYAAAATEWYFLTLCGRSKDFIVPV